MADGRSVPSACPRLALWARRTDRPRSGPWRYQHLARLFYILASAVRYRVPKITLLRMGLNIGIDYVVGSLPVVGDFADVVEVESQEPGVAAKTRHRFG